MAEEKPDYTSAQPPSPVEKVLPDSISHAELAQRACPPMWRHLMPTPAADRGRK